MPVFLRAFPLKDDSASVSKPRRPAERLREVRWQEDQTLDRVLIVADFGDGTSTIGSARRVRRRRGLSRVRKTRLGAAGARTIYPPSWGPTHHATRTQQDYNLLVKAKGG
jgi:hypothetical protein